MSLRLDSREKAHKSFFPLILSAQLDPTFWRLRPARLCVEHEIYVTFFEKLPRSSTRQMSLLRSDNLLVSLRTAFDLAITRNHASYIVRDFNGESFGNK